MARERLKCVRWMLGLVLATAGVSVGEAQGTCPAKVARDHVTLSYEFVPVIDGDATTMHVKVTMQGADGDQLNLRMPGEASKDTVTPWINLKAESAGTTIDPGDKPTVKVVHFKPGKPLVISYDLLKDWPGPLHPSMQFQPVIFPTYFELYGEKALAVPQLNPDVMVTANYDWRALPAGWTLATSFGAGSGAASRCQTFTGMREAIDQALFAGGDFRLHSFKVGEREVELAIRGAWTFSDDEAAAQLVKPIQLARTFWHDENFPYYLVTLAPFEGEGSTDGSQYTNAFWFFMGSKDVLSQPRIQKDLLHEAFHEWDPWHMGVQKEPQALSDWFQEGVTDYYANLLAYRNGILSAKEYADAMNKGLADYYGGSKSPYTQGLVLGIWLDSAIRKNSGGKQSLDDVMFEMVREAKEPLSEERVLRTLDKYLADGDRAILRAGIDHDGEVPLVGAVVAAPCMTILVGKITVFDLGVDFNKSKETKVIAGVEVDGPAYVAGLRDGQKLVTWSVTTPSTDKLEVFTVKEGDGQKTITFYAKKIVRAPKLEPQVGCSANE